MHQLIIIIIITTLFNEGYIIKFNKLIFIMGFKTTHTQQSYISWTSYKIKIKEHNLFRKANNNLIIIRFHKHSIPKLNAFLHNRYANIGWIH